MSSTTFPQPPPLSGVCMCMCARVNLVIYCRAKWKTTSFCDEFIFHGVNTRWQAINRKDFPNVSAAEHFSPPFFLLHWMKPDKSVKIGFLCDIKSEHHTNTIQAISQSFARCLFFRSRLMTFSGNHTYLSGFKCAPDPVHWKGICTAQDDSVSNNQSLPQSYLDRIEFAWCAPFKRIDVPKQSIWPNNLHTITVNRSHSDWHPLIHLVFFTYNNFRSKHNKKFSLILSLSWQHF